MFLCGREDVILLTIYIFTLVSSDGGSWLHPPTLVCLNFHVCVLCWQPGPGTVWLPQPQLSSSAPRPLGGCGISHVSRLLASECCFFCRFQMRGCSSGNRLLVTTVPLHRFLISSDFEIVNFCFWKSNIYIHENWQHSAKWLYSRMKIEKWFILKNVFGMRAFGVVVFKEGMGGLYNRVWHWLPSRHSIFKCTQNN